MAPDESHDPTMERYLQRREVEFVRRFLDGAGGPCRLLDLCCGSGRLSRTLTNTDLHVIGLDIDLTALTLFRQLSNRVPLVRGNALRLPLAEGGFDCVVAIHCFDHLDRIRFLQECHRILRSRGLLLFDSLNRRSYKWILKRLHRSLSSQSPANRDNRWIDVLSCDEVLRAATDCGFEVRAICGYSWVPFTRRSDGVLVDLAAQMEQLLQLDRHSRISPRILIAARKKPCVDMQAVPFSTECGRHPLSKEADA